MRPRPRGSAASALKGLTGLGLGILLLSCGGLRPPAELVPPTPRGEPTAQSRAHEPPPGTFHRVDPGQTLYTIARTYTVETLVPYLSAGHCQGN